MAAPTAAWSSSASERSQTAAAGAGPLRSLRRGDSGSSHHGRWLLPDNNDRFIRNGSCQPDPRPGRYFRLGPRLSARRAFAPCHRDSASGSGHGRTGEWRTNCHARGGRHGRDTPLGGSRTSLARWAQRDGHGGHAGGCKRQDIAALGALGTDARRGFRTTSRMTPDRQVQRTICKPRCLWHIGIAGGGPGGDV